MKLMNHVFVTGFMPPNFRHSISWSWNPWDFRRWNHFPLNLQCRIYRSRYNPIGRPKGSSEVLVGRQKCKPWKGCPGPAGRPTLCQPCRFQPRSDCTGKQQSVRSSDLSSSLPEMYLKPAKSNAAQQKANKETINQGHNNSRKQ